MYKSGVKKAFSARATPGEGVELQFEKRAAQTVPKLVGGSSG